MGEGEDGRRSQWYKDMHQRIHQQPNKEGSYIQVQYKNTARYPYDPLSGYASEPEQDGQRQNSGRSPSAGGISSVVRDKFVCDEPVKYTHPVYRNEPGKIANYLPGKSSVAKRRNDSSKTHRPFQKQNMAYILTKDTGYDSDSTLVFKKREPQTGTPEPIEPAQQKESYKEIQKGGDIPVSGLRRPAPEKPKGPSHKYQEGEVNIHYRTPVRIEEKTWIPEHQLRMQQEAALRKIYQEERRRKYLQELQDLEMRRHQDYTSNPIQKNLIPSNRYDGLEATKPPPVVVPKPKADEKRIAARALYDFHAQNGKELSFMKGDVIYVGRRVDKNWYEGERHASRGIFPVSYVQLLNSPGTTQPGQALAKFTFAPQLPNEIGFAKGDMVTLLRRVDHNWWEGRIGPRQGIFPAAYVEVIIEPEYNASTMSPARKPIASPASHSLIMNQPPPPPQHSAAMRTELTRFDSSPSGIGSTATSANGLSPRSPVALHASASASTTDSPSKAHQQGTPARAKLTASVVSQAEPVQYQALYPYHPVNDDELELREGDLVDVFEKCDDGWYVGTSLRTGLFGTFPGNYVQIV